MTVIERIDALRIERGWSVNYLAMEAMLTQSTVNNLYVRKTEPKITTLRQICGAFGLTLSEFFAGTEEPPSDSDVNRALRKKIDELPMERKRALLKLLC